MSATILVGIQGMQQAAHIPLTNTSEKKIIPEKKLFLKKMGLKGRKNMA